MGATVWRHSSAWEEQAVGAGVEATLQLPPAFKSPSLTVRIQYRKARIYYFSVARLRRSLSREQVMKWVGSQLGSRY